MRAVYLALSATEDIKTEEMTLVKFLLALCSLQHNVNKTEFGLKQ